MCDAWFAEKLAPDGDVEDGCHPQEAQAMKKYLRQEMTAQEAASAITQPVVNAEDPSEDLRRLWGFLIDALIELPCTDLLIKLLQAIEDLPEPDMTAVAESKLPTHGKLWRGLPGFGHQYADLCQSGDWRGLFIKADAAERKRLQSYHIKKAGIEARLVVAGLAGIPIDWGYETVADALERSDALLDCEIPAAAEWLNIAGQRFRAGAAEGEQS